MLNSSYQQIIHQLTNLISKREDRLNDSGVVLKELNPKYKRLDLLFTYVTIKGEVKYLNYELLPQNNIVESIVVREVTIDFSNDGKNDGEWKHNYKYINPETGKEIVHSLS